jgi:hypothetical protein
VIRKKAIHENEFQSPLSTHLFVQRFISEIDEANYFSKAQARLVDQPHESVVKWIPPPLGHVKIKVDGAVSRTQQFGSYSAICKSETYVSS